MTRADLTVPMPIIVAGDARALPLPDASVDLIVTSPPYFGLRDYGVDGQIGAEASPAEFIAALIECTREMVRVLKPSGSIFVNLGDKYAGSPSGPRALPGGDKTSGQWSGARRRAQHGVPAKSLTLLPERYRIAAVDELGLIARAVLVWSKPNGLPESVTDRVRRSHEDWAHLTKSPRYFAAVDEIREPYGGNSHPGRKDGRPSPATAAVQGARPMGAGPTQLVGNLADRNPLGKLPGSVWEVATQPLNVPEHVSHRRCCGGTPRAGCAGGLDHYAAMPMAWPLRIIPGWCPREVCAACGEGRRPVVERGRYDPELLARRGNASGDGRATRGINTNPVNLSGSEKAQHRSPDRITGYACACPDTTAPSTPGVVLDPFGGTSTTALVAAMLGYIGISVDLSLDYCRDLATWRVSDPKERARAAGLDPDAVAAVKTQLPGQFDLFEGVS